jgi:hypothetical protein
MSSASVEIEDISIDSVNAANLRRRVNRSLMVQTAEHTATIDGSDLEIAWRYAGYCRARSETAMEFSIDSTNVIPFSHLDCQGFDLRHDPRRKHPIQPLLIGPDGISKKIALPFLEPLSAHQPFDLALRCRLPMIYTPGVCHYTSTLSFDQKHVGHCGVNLRFTQTRPSWVRVYEIDGSGRERLLKSLYPVLDSQSGCEYRDVTENIPAKSVRIYMFKLDEPPA